MGGNARAFVRVWTSEPWTRPRPTWRQEGIVRHRAWFTPGPLGWFFRRGHFRCFRQYHGDDDRDGKRFSTSDSQRATNKLKTHKQLLFCAFYLAISVFAKSEHSVVTKPLCFNSFLSSGYQFLCENVYTERNLSHLRY